MTSDELGRHAERLLAAHALADADPAPLAGLLARCTERRLATGQPLFQEGDPEAEVSFLLEGRVSVLKKDPAGSDRQIGAWFAPAVVGGLAAVEGARRSASCIAGAPSVVASALGGRRPRGAGRSRSGGRRAALHPALGLHRGARQHDQPPARGPASRRDRNRRISIACSRCFTAPALTLGARQG